MSRLQTAIDQIVFARRYSERLLAAVDDADWFRLPAEGITHLAWQMGHLAMAQYRLALQRIRGTHADDERLIATEFIQLFGKGSIPSSDPERYPPVLEIRAVFERVHRRLLDELPNVADAALDQPPERPHAIAGTKLASLQWCAHHEMVHAGQIALLRRLLGHAPLW